MDGPGDNYLRGISRGGQIFDIALNRLTRKRRQCAAVRRGVRRSDVQPDGETLFINIQAREGITFAIWGPWARFGV